MSLFGYVIDTSVPLGVPCDDAHIYCTNVEQAKHDMNYADVCSVSTGPHYYNAVQFKPDLKNPHNIAVGIMKRIAARLPPAMRSLLLEIETFTQMFCDEMVPIATELVQTKDWIENRPWSRGRKNEFFKLYERQQQGLLTQEEKSRFAEILGFIKDEFYEEVNKFPRGIFSRSDLFKLMSGPIFSTIEKIVFNLKYFIKKVPVADRAKFISELFEGITEVVSTDFTSFESSFTELIMASIEFILYKHVMKNFPEELEIIMKVLGGPNLCNFDNIFAIIAARRMSGEMCTSLGNGFSNLMITLFSYEKSGINWREVIAVVEGDDGNHGSIHGPCSSEWYAKLGFNIKFDVNEKVNHASFCGLVFDEETKTNIANPIRHILRFGWTSSYYKQVGQRTMCKLIRAKALSFAYQYPRCPILAPLAHKYLRLTRKFAMRRDDNILLNGAGTGSAYNFNENLPSWDGYNDEQNIDFSPPSDYTREIMFQHHKITLDHQISIEREILEINDLGPLRLPTLDQYIDEKYRVHFEEYTRIINVFDYEKKKVTLSGDYFATLF